jgi:hypothetical protein
MLQQLHYATASVPSNLPQLDRLRALASSAGVFGAQFCQVERCSKRRPLAQLAG